MTLPNAGRPLEPLPSEGWVRAVARYVAVFDVESRAAHAAAHLCLLDSLATALTALRDPKCLRLIGPVVPGATMQHGARIPGTSIELDPVMAAFSLGVLLRGPHGDDRPLTSPWGHPGDALGALLGAADYAARKAHNEARPPATVRDLLGAMIKACEIQGLSLAALDHASRVRIAAAASALPLLGGGAADIENALRHAASEAAAQRPAGVPVDAPRRSRLASGDAPSRGLRLALLALAGEPGPLPLAAAAPPDRPLGAHRMTGLGMRLGALAGAARPEARFHAAVVAHFGARRGAQVLTTFAAPERLAATPVDACIAALVSNR